MSPSAAPLARVALPLLLLAAACSGRFNGVNQSDTQRAAANTGVARTAVCQSSLRTFTDVVWQPLMGMKCYGCHHTGGIAQMNGSSFLYVDRNLPSSMAANYDITRRRAQSDPNFLLKPTNQVAHYGGQVIDPNGSAYAVLADFVAHAGDPPQESCPSADINEVSTAAIFPSAGTTLRKTALLLAGRLPSSDELRAVAAQGSAAAATEAAVNTYTQSDAFLLRLMDWYNNTLLTDKYVPSPMGTQLFADVATVNWYGDGSTWSDPNQYARAVAETNRALAREPLFIVAYTVKNDLPLTNILTSRTTVVNPFSACALGVQNQIKFNSTVTCNPREAAQYDPLDLQQVTLNPRQVGLLSTRAFLNRHTTTPTNRNRHRYNTVTTAFMGSNILELSPVRLAASAAAAIKTPTMTLRDCTVCHAVMDPGAGLLQQYGPTGMPITDAWFTDMFPPGFAGSALPTTAAADPLRYLGEQVVADPRFARQSVLTIYGMLTGTPLPALSTDPNQVDGGYDLYTIQSQAVDNWTALFVNSNYNVRTLVRAIVTSPYFTMADVKAGAAPQQLNLAASVVNSRILTPEALDRKLTGIFGQTWTAADGSSLLLGDLYMFYGGINSDTATVRASNASGLMANIGLRLGTDMACRTVPHAFSGDPSAASAHLKDVLFPSVGLGDTPTTAPQAVRATLVQLFWTLLGAEVGPNDGPVNDAVQLMQQTMAQVQADRSTTLPAACQATTRLDNGGALPPAGQLVMDPTGMVQAWMAVISYMISDFDFLYE